MAGNVQVESKRVLEKFKRVSDAAAANVKRVIAETTGEALADAKARANIPVTKGQRSRPGQSPRRETGRYWRSLTSKLSPKGWVGYLTTSAEAQDAKGRRYPWMLESGTKTVSKRPLFKAVQKAVKRKYQQKVGRAMIAAVRRGNT